MLRIRNDVWGGLIFNKLMSAVQIAIACADNDSTLATVLTALAAITESDSERIQSLKLVPFEPGCALAVGPMTQVANPSASIFLSACLDD